MESEAIKTPAYTPLLTDEQEISRRVYAEGELLSACPMLEIDFVAAGSGIHRIFGQSFPCAEGDIYIVQEHIPHGFFSTESQVPLTVRRLRLRIADWLSGDAAKPESDGYCFGLFPDGAPMAYAMLTQQSRLEINQYADSIMKELHEQRYGWFEKIGALLTLLLVTVSRYVQSAVRDELNISAKERGVVQSVIRTVDDHFDENDLTLEKLAASLYMSTSGLSRLFNQYMGQSFSDYIRSYRMEQVCRLLKETGEPINTVVQKCGIRDIPNFYRTFQQYTGMTPSRYRHYWESQPASDQVLDVLEVLSQKIQAGKNRDVSQLIAQALEQGKTPEDIMNKGLVAGMYVVGSRFKNNEIFVPEVLLAARAMNTGLQLLQPYLVNENVRPLGKAVICTVKGDMHDIGKNLVKIMLEGHGFSCLDLGVDVSPERVAAVVKEQQPDLVCLSALLTTTLPALKDIIDLLSAEGVRDSVAVMVGGAPVTPEYAAEIGADFYTVDAAQAAEKAVGYMRQKENP